MDFRHMLASAFARRIAYLVIAALLGLASSWWNTASAQPAYTCGSTASPMCAKEQARLQCLATAEWNWNKLSATDRARSTYTCLDAPTGSPKPNWYCRLPLNAGGYFNCGTYGGQVTFFYDASRQWCQSGAPPDPENPGQCLSTDKCLARNSSLGNSTGTRAFTSNTNTTSCVGGCMMDFSGQTSPVRKGKMWNAQGLEVDRYFVSGEYKYNGQMCGADYTAGTPEQQNTKTETKESAKPKAEECTPVGGGQTMCRKGDGRFCATASTGREICWKPHEVGSKADGEFVQTKKPGTSNGEPSISLSNGDTATKTNDVRIQETSTLNGQTRTSDSVLSTYKTTSGADATPKSEGQPTSTGGVSSGGMPVPDGSDKGEEDGDGDTAGGGATCSAAPTCSGDVINCAILEQQWRTRCANDQNDNGMDDWLEPKEGDGALPDDGQDGEPGTGEKEISASLIEMGGFGGSRSCPALGSINIPPFGTFSFDDKPWLCDMVNLIRALMYLLAAFVSIRILME